MTSIPKVPKVLDALIPLVFLIGLLIVTIQFFGTDALSGANQIVLVTPHPQLNLSKTLESMDVIWVEGELKETRTKTASGVSGYSLEAIKVYPYKALHNTNK